MAATRSAATRDRGRNVAKECMMETGDEDASPPRLQMLPSGWIAEVVTYLEMRTPPPLRPDTAGGLSLRRMSADVADFRRMFRLVGEAWLWASQLRRSDTELGGALASDALETYTLLAGPDEIGLLQLDFRTEKACELSFFGVVPEAIGAGAGRYLMNRAIDRAWARAPGIDRFWVHTCTNDHPEALAFYIRSGFVPYARHRVLPISAARGTAAKTGSSSHSNYLISRDPVLPVIPRCRSTGGRSTVYSVPPVRDGEVVDIWAE